MPGNIDDIEPDERIVEIELERLQEMIRPSEKAFAYKMKYEAIKRKTDRRNGGQIMRLC